MDSQFFILFDHFKETVHWVLDGFGIDKPFNEMSQKGDWVARRTKLGAVRIPCGKAGRIDSWLIEKPLCQILVIFCFNDGPSKLSKGEPEVSEKIPVDTDGTAE